MNNDRTINHEATLKFSHSWILWSKACFRGLDLCSLWVCLLGFFFLFYWNSLFFFFNVSIIRMTDVSVLFWDCEEFYSWEFRPLFCLFSAILKCHVNNISGTYLTGWSSLFAELLKIWTDICIHPFHVLVNTFIQIKTVLRHNFQDQDRQTHSKRGSGSRFMHAVVFWAFAEVFSLRMLLFCLHCCYLYVHLCYWLCETLDSNALT